MIERYDTFRTNFVYEQLDEPWQIVLKHRSARLYYEDITHLSGDKKTFYLEEFKGKDLERGFDLAKDILMRLSLFKTAANSCQIVWSSHHILMDGWCIPIIFKELIQIYQSLRQGSTVDLGETPSYINYIKWLEKQDKEKALRYWEKYLDGYEQQAGLPITGGNIGQGEDDYE